MGKQLILLFDVEDFNLDELQEMSPDKRYKTAQENLDCCDIYTIEDFCTSLNNGEDCLSAYWVLPCLVSETEYEKWWK